MTTEQREVEQAHKLLAARGTDDWNTDAENGFRFAEVTFIDRGDGKIAVSNCSYARTKQSLAGAENA